MSTVRQIRAVYRQDQKHPYYSLQMKSHDISSKPAKLYRSDPRWTWGHFSAALDKAWKELRAA